MPSSPTNILPAALAGTPSVVPAGHLLRQVDAAALRVVERWTTCPRMGIILGTGAGNLAREIDDEAVLKYDDIPGFPRSTAAGHTGQLVCGGLRGIPTVVMEGRFHIYEGYPAWQITLPVRVMHALGVRLLVVSNAAGAVNPNYQVGDVMAVEDHINLMGINPLTGPTNEKLGDRFPDRGCPYDSSLIAHARRIARQDNFVCHRGVYVALSGPNYETRAEYRFVRKLGGDVVGMSTVPEVLVARQLGLRVLALSTVTNICLPDAPIRTDGDDVVAAAAAAEHKLRSIVLGIARKERL